MAAFCGSERIRGNLLRTTARKPAVRFRVVAAECSSTLSHEVTMLHYALVFLALALLAGVLGFGGIASTAAGIAKILFVIFLLLFVVSLIAGRGWV